MRIESQPSDMVKLADVDRPKYPAPVGVATMRLRHGLSLPEAEAKLVRELG